MRPDLSVNYKHTRTKRIAQNTGLMVGSRLTGVFLGLGSLSLATKFLAPYEWGTLVFIHAYMLFFSEVTAFQSWQAIIRFGTDDLHNKDEEKLSKLIGFGIRLDAVAAIIAFIMAIVLFGFSIWLGQKYLGLTQLGDGLSVEKIQIYSAAYCSLILLRQRGASTGVFRLFDQFEMLAIHALIMPAVRLVGAIIALMMGAGFEGFLIAWFVGSFCEYLFLPIMAMRELKRRNLLGKIFKAKVNFFKPNREGLWPFVIKSNIDATLGAATLHLPSLLVFVVFGPVWNGIYKIAEEVAKLLSETFKLLDQVIYPELARMISEGKAGKIWRLTTRAAVLLFLFGCFWSVVFFLFGEPVLRFIASDSFAPAVPMAVVLVPAAAFMGAAAPLYPVFFAADHPERAIYARGAGVLIYVASFFSLAQILGPMSSVWAVFIGNLLTVIIVTILAKYTLEKYVKSTRSQGVKNDRKIYLAGDPDARLWGLGVREWQSRAFKKFGLGLTENPSEADVWLDAHYILSNNLIKAFVATEATALIVKGRIIGTTDGSVDMLGREASAAKGLVAAGPEDIVPSYDAALRKTERPTALDIRETSADVIMKHQFAGSYKGITDFVTKFIWPLPAYYVTRLCAYLRMTPNMVTTIGLGLMFAALYYFWQGQWWLGFATGWAMTFLDTVDGKLARTTMTFSSWGNVYDHGIDLIHPPFWYWAWFIGLGGHFVWPEITSDPMTLALVAILVGYIIDRIIEGIFIAQHGFHIHVWRPINSALRFIIARRNPNMFIFMIAIFMSLIWPNAGHWGFYAVAIWTWLCIAFNIIVVIIGSFKRGKIQSWMNQARP